jgi:hypothetical protein
VLYFGLESSIEIKILFSKEMEDNPEIKKCPICDAAISTSISKGMNF